MSIGKSINTDEFGKLSEALLGIHTAASNIKRVEGSTHLHYKYPAGFSPTFPRAVMKAFSREGDWILDPFVGGGTTIVEAKAMRRNAVGVDINDLAIFSAKLKLLSLPLSSLTDLDNWIEETNFNLSNKKTLNSIPENSKPWFENVPEDIARAIYCCAQNIQAIKNSAGRIFARGVLLRTSQVMLDNRNFVPTVREFRKKLTELYNLMLDKSMPQFSNITRKGESARVAQFELICGNSADPDVREEIRDSIDSKIRVVVTSPPYPGVHVLYNKWQINGRRESRVPYFIIGSNEHRNQSVYTMGYRKSKKGLSEYFESIRSVYSNLRNLLSRGVPIVQLVAFNHIDTQIDLFLDAMSTAGFREVKAYQSVKSSDGRMWRSVPHRKWYTSIGNTSHSSHEVVLIHTRK